MLEPLKWGFKMSKISKQPGRKRKTQKNSPLKDSLSKFLRVNIFFIFLISAILIEFSLFEPSQEVEADLVEEFPGLKEGPEARLVIFQDNTLAPISNPANPEPPAFRKLRVIATGYSSSPWETDGDPHITAAGTLVRDGIVANNYLAIGTKIRIPELFGGKIFVVEDRMSWKKGNYHIDIWFPSYWEAKNFGAKRTYIEILES